MAGRPKAFDRDAALARAMDLFWTQGYHATSLQHLTDHLQIGRQSLYDTFGSKHALFVESLRLYDRTVVQQTREVLDAPGPALDNLHRVVRLWSERACAPPRRGCLINNTVTELTLHDPEVAGVVRAHLQRLEAALHDALERAAPDLPDGADPRTLARFLAGTCQGMIVMGKAGMGPDALADVARAALSVLE